MRKVLLATLTFLLFLPITSCDNGGSGGGGGAAQTTDGGNGALTASRTHVVDNAWVNANGRSVPIKSFGLPSGVKITVVAPPAHGALSKGNTFYTPTADYEGEDTFTFKATNASGQAYPYVFRVTFKKVDAKPPESTGFTFFAVTASAFPTFFRFNFQSTSDVTMTINNTALGCTNVTTLYHYPWKNYLGGNQYRFDFLGNFIPSVTPGTWFFSFDLTFTDEAGNSYRMKSSAIWSSPIT